ncbi:hypothetical protein GCM10027187_27670 [Streptosporangium sandarakinum]
MNVRGGPGETAGARGRVPAAPDAAGAGFARQGAGSRTRRAGSGAQFPAGMPFAAHSWRRASATAIAVATPTLNEPTRPTCGM